MFWEPDTLVPLMIFTIPIIAIVGGITAGILKSISQHRLMELAQRERIVAIEKGIDLDKLPPPISRSDEWGLTPYEYDRRRSQSLMVGGLITLAVGISVAAFLKQVTNDEGVWAVGLIPASIGVALLLSAYLVRARNGNGAPKLGPPAS